MTPDLAGAEDPEAEQAVSPRLEMTRAIATVVRPRNLRYRNLGAPERIVMVTRVE
jgi:hypothetical protein